jgi:tetratricopeptide (TPR) repeat protein
LGRPAEALSQIQDASVLDPVSLSINTEIGRVYYWNRQYDLAIEAFGKGISLDPQFARAHTRLGMAYAAKKDYSAAVREFEQSEELSGSDPYLEGLAGYAQAQSGNTARARKIMTDLTDRAKRHQFVPAFSLALVCIGLGDRNGALDWLDRAYQDRSTYMVYAKADPLLDPVRADARFGELMRRMGLVAQ